jgi:hypothetical protein
VKNVFGFYGCSEEEYDYGAGEGEPFLKCRHCGATDVRWGQRGGRWVLFSTTSGVEHRCPLNPDVFSEVL